MGPKDDKQHPKGKNKMKENMNTITGRGKPVEIPAAELKFAPWNPRPEITDEDVAELAASFADNGLLNRLSVVEVDGQKIVFAGNRRLAACRVAGVKNIPCELFDISVKEARVLTALENLQRKDVEPIREAGLVEECLSSGLTGEEIAAKIGKSNAWVTRRRKLLSLPKEIREAAEAYPGKITADCLENIAARPEAAKKCVAEVCQRIQYEDRVTWQSLRYKFEQFEHDLDSAPFVKFPKCCSAEECANCPNRTGAQGDLFGVVENGLGKCLDRKCFAKMLKNWEEAVIRDSIPEGTETVRLRYGWEMPSDSSEKPSKKHPCAYIYFNASEDGGFVIRYGESLKAKQDREAAKRAESEAAANERRERDSRFFKLCKIVQNISDDDKDVRKFFATLTKNSQLNAYVREAVVEHIAEVYDERDEVLRVVTIFPFIRDRMTKEDVAFIRKFCKEQ